ncbi:hypothetical protein V1525DRAFT_227625 [Lipomyces kononenkoae]|uniref:Uncharacterized protein n=1 Tax=Lipomyces kononenkoae TaxID=34357 RepID=A0ACC3T9A2_LIPKO
MDTSLMLENEQLFEIPLPRIMELAKEHSAHIYLIPEYCAPRIAHTEVVGGRSPQIGYIRAPKAFMLQPGDQPTFMPSVVGGRDPAEIGPPLTLKKTAMKPAPAQPSAQSKRKVAKVPRPRNAFIIYRGAKHDEVMRRGDISNTSASRIIAKMWKDEPLPVREYYRRLAVEESLNHKLQHPEYKYSPRRPGEKQRRSRRTKDSSSKLVNMSMSSSVGTTVRRPLSRSPSGPRSPLKSDFDAPSFSGELFTVDCLPFCFSIEDDQGGSAAMQDPLKNVTSNIGMLSSSMVAWQDEHGSLYM